MAIAGVILHVAPGAMDAVRDSVNDADDLHLYGEHDGQYLVSVAELPSSLLRERMEAIEKWSGVLAVYTTYVNLEDELGQ